MIVVVITARLNAERLPRKVLLDLGGISALQIQVLKARAAGLPVVVAVPDDEAELVDYARTLPVDKVQAGDPQDVVSRVYHAAKEFRPKVIIRGLPDCPFFDYKATLRRAEVLAKFGIAHATRSRSAYAKEPVYGADEPAYSWQLVEHMLGAADEFEREHFGSFVDRRRTKVNILYTPSPPTHLYRDEYRPFRLELDTPEDYEMLRRLIDYVGPFASISSAVSVLERYPDLVRINSHIAEKTGPKLLYEEYKEEYEFAHRRTFPLNGELLLGLGEDYTPVMCAAGTCLVGYKDGGNLRRLSGEKLRGGEVTCSCGAGKIWYHRISSS